MRTRPISIGLTRLLAAGLAVPLALAGVVLAPATSPAQAAAAVAEENPGDPALPSYPELPPNADGPNVFAQVTTTALPCDDNGADKNMTRSEAVKRARSWTNVHVPYSQSRCYRNQYGDYRTDCSGFVSMAWGLGGAGSSFWTGNLDTRTTPISRSALKPGDALLRHSATDTHVNHVALFVRWSNSKHKEPTVIEQTGSDDTVEDTWSESKASNYTPVRYDNIVEDAAPIQPRIGVVTTGGSALVKEGSLSAAWTTERTDVQQVVVSGSRIGVLTTAGVALVKDGALNAGWNTEYTGVKQLALSGNRIGVLTTTGVALVKEGDPRAGWTTEQSGVKQLALAGDRIGILSTAGVVKVKDGDLSADWITQYSGVQQIALMADRVGVLTTTGDALVKDGTLNARWVKQYSGVQQLALGSDRIGVVTTTGTAAVKDGGLTAVFVTQHTDVEQLALAGDRIGIRTKTGTAAVKDGELTALWTTENTNIQQIALS